MRAEIEGEDEAYVKIYVTDNANTEHNLTIEKETGEIVYHEQDGYPDDPAKRSPAGIEHVSQARRYAQYYVYRERGHDTLPAGRNPDRIEAARQALESLEGDSFERYFGNYHRQFASHYDDIEPVIEPPIDVGFDISGGANTLKQLGKSGLERLLGGRSAENLYYRQTIYLEQDGSTAATFDADNPVSIDTTGELHALYEQGGEEFETEHDEPSDRVFDARLELAPVPPESLEQFHGYLVYHLACQVRDCYLTMGVSPPEQYRITGPGLVDALRRYAGFDVYQPYHDPDAKIGTWQDEYTPQDQLA